MVSYESHNGKRIAGTYSFIVFLELNSSLKQQLLRQTNQQINIDSEEVNIFNACWYCY